MAGEAIGVYAESDDGELAFHPLPFLTNDDVADILQIARARILALLRQKGVVEDDAVTSDAVLSAREPALAELAAASVAGTLPAGPALRRRDPVKLRGRPALVLTKALCAAQAGFSLHAATTAKAGDAAGREALCKYILRPPIAQERVKLVADDLVRLELKRPFSDATFALDLDPLALLARLATTVPPPRFHTIRYAGVLAAASNWRARVVPPPTQYDDNNDEGCTTSNPKDSPRTHRSGYRPWRELLMRSFKIDIERCDHCGARIKLLALVMTSAAIQCYLGEPTEPPTLAPACDPPFFKSRLIRRRLGEPTQAEMFDAH